MIPTDEATASTVPAMPSADGGLPVVIIGAGPVGLAAAANLRVYELPVLVL